MKNWRPSIFPEIPSMANGTTPSNLKAHDHLICGRALSEEEALSLAAAVEQESEHPIARAIVAAARQRQLVIPRATGFAALAGRGAQAHVADRLLKVGGPRLVEQEEIAVPASFREQVEQWGTRGQTVVYL